MTTKYKNFTDWADDFQSVFLNEFMWFEIGNEITMCILKELKSSNDKYIPFDSGKLTRNTRLKKMRVRNDLVRIILTSNTVYATKQYYTNPRGKQLWFEVVEVNTRRKNEQIIVDKLEKMFD